jgi:hypothetical protein
MVNGEENNQQKYCHFYHGYFDKGVRRGGLGEDVATPSTIVSVSLKFSSIYLAYSLVVCVSYICLPIIDECF